MTVNFIEVIDLADSVKCLSKLPNFKDIYITGNPCEDWKGCKEYFIANI
jgi:protein TilB